MKKIKVLNLYAGIGGNRKLWGNVDVTAVEIDKRIAQIYKKQFPQDNVIVGDAHEYLLKNYDKYDFIWSSPPCPSHSNIRILAINTGQVKPIYPDMKLYEEIIFLKQFCRCKWVVENVSSYYKPLITPQKLARHYFWSNFPISVKPFHSSNIKRGTIDIWSAQTGFDLSDETMIDKRKVYRNCVNPKLGQHIFLNAFKDIQQTLNL